MMFKKLSGLYFLVTFAESSCMSSHVITWEPGVNWRKVFKIYIFPANSAAGQNKFTRGEKPQSWSWGQLNELL